MKKVINVIFLIVIGLILLTIIGFWLTDTILRPSVIVLLVVILSAFVLIKNNLSKDTKDKDE